MECILLKTLSDSSMQYYSKANKVWQFIFTLLKVCLLPNNQFLFLQGILQMIILFTFQIWTNNFCLLCLSLCLTICFWIEQREGCTVHQSWHFPSEDLNCNLVRLLFLLHKSESALLGYLSHQCSAYHTCAKNTQCGNFMIFLSLRFYVKSSFGTLEVLKSAIFKCTLLEALNFDV